MPNGELQEKDRAKLDAIVQKMVQNNEPEENIKFVVEDFKKKYSSLKKKGTTGLPSEQKPESASLGTPPQKGQKPSVSSGTKTYAKSATYKGGKLVEQGQRAGQEFLTGLPGNEKAEYTVQNNEWRKNVNGNLVRIEDNNAIKYLNKHFKKEVPLYTEEIYTNFPQKEDNQYRIRDNKWQRLVPGAKSWQDISNQGSIDALNNQYGKDVKLSKVEAPKKQEPISTIGNLNDISFEDKDFVDRFKNLNYYDAKSVVDKRLDMFKKNIYDNDFAGNKEEADKFRASLKNFYNSEAYKIYNEKKSDINKKRSDKLDSLYYELKQSKTDKEKKEVKSRINSYLSEDLIKGQTDAYSMKLNDVNESYKKLKGAIRQFEIDKQNINNISDPNERQMAIDKLNKQAEYLDSRRQEIQNEGSSVVSEMNKLNTLAGKYIIDKEKTGSFGGAVLNKVIKGVSSIIEAPMVIGAELSKDVEFETLSPEKKKYLQDKGYDEDQIKNYLANENLKKSKKDLREGLVSAIGSEGTTEEYAQSKDRGFMAQAIFGLAESLPAMLTPGGAAARFTTMAAQSYSAIEDEMLNDKDFEATSAAERSLVATPYALAMGALENLGVSTVMSKSPLAKSLVLKTISGAAGKIGGQTTKEAFEKIIEKELKSNMAKFGVKVVGGALAEAETGALQSLIGDIGIKKAYNAIKESVEGNEDLKKELTGGEYFETPDTFGEGVKQVLTDAAAEALGGGIMSGTIAGVQKVVNGNLSMYDKEDTKFLKDLIDDDEIKKVFVNDLKTKMLNGTMTKSEAEQNLRNYNKAQSTFKSIPDNVEGDDLLNAVNLIVEKENLTEEIQGKDESLTAAQRARISEINTQLTKISEDATKKSNIEQQEIRPEGGIIQREGVDGGQQEVGQGEGGQRETTQPGTDLGDRNIPGEEEEVGANVRSVINRPTTLSGFGGVTFDTPLVGDTYVDGQQVVFEERGTGKIYELGNVDDVMDTEIPTLKAQEERISINPQGQVSIDGNNWNIQSELPTQGIEYNPAGEVMRVSLKDDNGNTTMFDGQDAVDIAYQIELQKIQSPEQQQLINDLLEQDEEFQAATADVKPGQAQVTIQEEATPDTVQASKQKTVSTHNEQGGSSISQTGEDLFGKPGFSVSVHPDRTMIVDGKNITEEDLDAFREANKDLLQDPENFIGTWYDQSSGKTYIDISTRKENKQDAIDLAISANQKAIFDLDNGVEIDTGGTGENIQSEVESLGEFLGSTDQEIDQNVERISDKKMAKIIARAAKALSKILPDVRFVVHYTDADFKKAIGEENSKEKVGGVYDSYTKTVHINLQYANKRTVAHEVFHAILLNKVKTNANAQAVTKRMVQAIASKIEGNEKLKKYLDDFISGYDENIQDEEKLAELVGALSQYYMKASSSIQDIIYRWLNKIADMFGLDPFNRNEVYDMLNTIARKVAKGKVISEAEVKGFEGEQGKQTGSQRRQAVTLMKGTENLVKYGLNKGKNITRKVGEALEKRQRQKYGFIEQSDRSESAKDKISNWMVDEVKYFIETMGDKSGKGWYGEKYQKALDNMSKIFPEMKSDQNARDLFTMLVAITSDGQKVLSNFKLAAFAYDYYKKNGKMPSTLPGQRTASFESNLNKINKLLSDYKGDISAIKKDLMEIKSIEELNKERKKEGLDPLQTSWPVSFKAPFAASIFGPKLGMFYSNLSGNETYPTLDRWWSRTFNRYRGTLIPEVKGGITKKGERQGIDRFKELLGDVNMSDEEAILASKTYRDSYAKKGYKNGSEVEKAANTIYKIAYENLNDAPFNKTDRQFMYDSVTKALSKLNKQGYDLSIADVQAILWYFEKNLYKTLGVQANIEGISYEDAANTTFQKWKENNKSFDYNIKESEDDAGVEGADTEISEQPSIRKQKALPTEVSEKLTEDGKGNYVFHHYSKEKRETIKPRSGDNIITGKDEASALSSVGGVAQYYTMADQAEPGVGPVLHTVVVPKDKVYYLQKDSENFYDQAKKEFEKVRPGQAFSPNYQAAWIAKVANDNGYDMLISNWRNNEFRAQTTKELTPIEGNIDFKERAKEGFKVGDEVMVYGMKAKVTSIDGPNLEFKGDGGSGSINFERNSRSITKLIPTTEEVNSEVDSMDQTIKKQKDNTVAKIVKKAKDAGYSDAAIVQYLRNNGYTFRQANNAIIDYNLKAEDVWIADRDTRKDSIKSSLRSFRKRALSARGFLPRSVFRYKELMNASIANQLFLVDKNTDKFSKMYSQYKGDQEQLLKDFDAYLRGNKNVALPQEFEILANSMRNQIDGLSKMLIDSGLVDADMAQTIMDNMGSYLTRSYEVFDNKNWKDKVQDEIVQKAKNYLRSQYRPWAEKNAQDTGETVEYELERLVDEEIDKIIDRPQNSSFFSSAKLGSKDLSVLKERQDIPFEIRALMGEYSDPALTYAETVLNLANLAAKHNFLSQIRKEGLGTYFFEENDVNRPKEFNTKIAADKSKVMSPLNGLMTTKEIAEAFEKEFNSRDLSPWIKTLIKIQSSVKYSKTILSFGTHIKNFFGNIGFLWMNGHVDLKESKNAFNIIRNELFKGSKEDLKNKIAEYIKAGVVNQSAGLNEIRDMFKDANFDIALAKRISNKKVGALGTAKRKVLKFKKGIEDWYQAEDDFFKIIGYEMELSRYADALYGKDKSQLTPDELEEVKKVAVENVKNTYPSYDRIPPAIKFISKSYILGNFISFQAEAYRTLYNTFALAKEELKSDNPEIKKIGAKRLVGASTYLTAKSALISAVSMAAGTGLTGIMGAFGDDDDEKEKDKDIRKFIPDWSKNSDLIVLSAGDGKIKYIDFSAADPHGGLRKALNAFLNGETTEKKFIDGLIATVQPFLGTEMSVETVNNLYNNIDKYGNQIWNPEDNAFNKSSAILNYLYSAAEPGTVSSIRRGVKAENKVAELAANLTGYRIYDVEVDKQFSFKMADVSDRIKDAKRIYNSKYYNEKATQEEVDKAYDDSQKSLDKIYKEILDNYDSAERLGVDYETLVNSLKEDANMSKKDINTLLSGELPELEYKQD